MRYRKTEIWKSVDWITILLYLIMVIAGWFSICGASYEFDNVGLFDPSGRPGMQMIWIGTSLALIFVILMLESDFFDIFAYLIYACVIVLLIATIFLAPNIKGSHSWLVLGPIRLQPAELAKFATALAVAKFMNGYGFKLTTVKNFSITLFLIFLPMVCILLQKETGSALVYLAFFLMLYREGMTGYILLIGVCAVVFFVTGMKYSEVMVGITPLGELIVSCLVLLITMGLVGSVRKDYISVKIMLGGIASTFLIGYVVSLFVPVNFAWISIGLVGAASIYLFYLSIRNWVWHYALIALFALGSICFLFSVDYVFNDILEPHQQIRIKVSLGLEDDPSGAGYNVNQSKIAIGSGGLFGLGLGGSRQKFMYLPESQNDFVFSIVCEELGFIGAVTVIILFLLLVIRGLYIASKAKDKFGMLITVGITVQIGIQALLNIAVVSNSMPNTGISLPFFSYGGTALIMQLAEMGIILNVSRQASIDS